MDVLMNGLLLAATLFAGGYCWVLAGRVRELKSLDRGLGGAIVTLTRQIELARGTLEEARASTRENRQDLTQLLARADATTAQLRLAVVAAEEARDRLPEPRLGMLRSAPEPLEPEAEPVTAPVLRAPAPEMATSTPARAEARLELGRSRGRRRPAAETAGAAAPREPAAPPCRARGWAGIGRRQ